MKNKNEKVNITVSGYPSDMQGWFAEKSARILEELGFLADTLHRPEDAPAEGWPDRKEEIDFHLSQAVKSALAVAALCAGRTEDFKPETIARIVDGGRREYLAWRDAGQS